MKKWLWSMLVVLIMMVAPGVEVRAEDYTKPVTIPTGEVVGDSGYVWRSGDPETLVHIQTGEVYTLPIRVSVLHNIHAIGDGRFILEGWQEWMVWNPQTGSKTVFPIEAGSGLHAVVDINLAAETVLWTDDKKYVTTSLSGKILGSIQMGSMYEAYGLLDDGNVLAFVDGQVTKRTPSGEALETLGSYTGQVRGASLIKGSDQWIVAKAGESDTLFIFDFVTKRWIEKEAPSVRDLTWEDGVYYFTIRKTYTTFYVSYNVATNEWREAPIDDVFVERRGSWYVFSENRSAGYTPESFWKAPWQLNVNVPKTTTRYEVGRPYDVNGTVTLVDGTVLPVPGDALAVSLDRQEAPFLWEQGNLTLQTNESYNTIFKWNDLERRLDLWASNYVPLTLDPPKGVLGPINGQTTPDTPVFISVTKNLYQANSSDSLLNYQSATVRSDESGRYTWQPARWFTPGSRVTVKIGSGSGVYADPIELQTVKESDDTSSNDISVLTNTVTSGVTLKTTPHAAVDVLIRSGKYYEISNEQADEEGLISIKEFDTMPVDIGTKVYFKLKEAPASAFRLTTVETRVEPPVFTWTRTPLMYDKSINVTSSTDQAYRIYRNGTHVATTRTMPYTFETPLKEGEVILVTRSSGDATYELTKTVRAFTPTLSVTDTLMTKTQATLSIKKTSTATVRFYVNDKLVSAKRLSTTRYTIPAKPGDRVRVKASVGSKSRDVSLELPKTSLSTLSINDEKSLWVGYMIPNSTVTLKNGSKVLATAKASSTGRVTLRFTRQPVNATLSLTSQSGTFRHVQTAKVTTGPTPTLVTTIPSSASKTLKATSNVAYGTLTLTRGSTVIAKKTVTATSTTLSFTPQKKGTKLTLRLVTPKGRSVTKTIYVR
ncbi:MAG: hypothetical protein F9K39_00360 [Exiguobacterium chiriqhucha]|uniref:hypothetical protein n=1 Tax=Exiguobacterium chiriqhucha TaxID=1385984 RepID=UPI00144C36ED|nr:hypothetical protein [Exiguobacterium chiriqhucha]KAB2865859.1 MAG: hypothetical protein F9K39_00360 [Exiguobacterium chiriqhucha]